MKLLGLTLRVTCSEKERSDTLDQRWYTFLHACGFTPLLLPNDVVSLKLVETLPLKGIIFTGGNSLVSLGGEAPERDCLEKKLIGLCVQKKIPLLGVCRGMQVIQNFFGVSLGCVEGHAGVFHEISNGEEKKIVNSFHHYGSKKTVKDLEVLEWASDGVVESVRHRDLPIRGIMWHPERMEPFMPRDIDLIRKYFSCL